MPLLQMEIWVRLEMISRPHYVWNVCLLQYGILVSASSKISLWYKPVEAKTLCIHGSTMSTSLACCEEDLEIGQQDIMRRINFSSGELKLSNVDYIIAKQLKTWHQKSEKKIFQIEIYTPNKYLDIICTCEFKSEKNNNDHLAETWKLFTKKFQINVNVKGFSNYKVFKIVWKFHPCSLYYLSKV